MKNDVEIFETLRAEGLIGRELNKLINEDYEDSNPGVIARTVLHASLKAFENAKKTNVPLLIKEGDFLYEIKSDGSKKIIKTFPKSIKHHPKKITLK